MVKKKDVTIYTMPGCGWCTKQKEVLPDLGKGIRDRIKVVNCSKTTCQNINAFPTIKIGDKRIIEGFRPADELAAEIKKA